MKRGGNEIYPRLRRGAATFRGDRLINLISGRDRSLHAKEITIRNFEVPEGASMPCDVARFIFLSAASNFKRRKPAIVTTPRVTREGRGCGRPVVVARGDKQKNRPRSDSVYEIYAENKGSKVGRDWGREKGSLRWCYLENNASTTYVRGQRFSHSWRGPGYNQNRLPLHLLFQPPLFSAFFFTRPALGIDSARPFCCRIPALKGRNYRPCKSGHACRTTRNSAE